MPDVIQNTTVIEIEQSTTVVEVLESVSAIEMLRDSNIFIDGGGGGFYYPFGWGDATPTTIFTLQAGKILQSIVLKIITPFDSPSAIALGVNGNNDFFMPSTANSPQQAGIYTVTPYYRNTVDTDIILSIVPGDNNSTGSGFIFLQLG